MSTPPPPVMPAPKTGFPVDPHKYVEPGTAAAKMLAVLCALVALFILALTTWGVGLLLLPIGWLIDYFNRKKAMALLRGSAIEVGPDQFPEIHACAADFAARLGMKELPAIYIVEGNMLNAAAARIGTRQVITLIDDVVDACLRSGEPRTLSFILGHEMAHHALGHTSRWQSMLSMSFKKLSRLNELSCDAVAAALVGDRSVSAQAIVVLLTGPQLVQYVNINALLEQAASVAADKSTLHAERRLSHPLLLRRLKRLLG